MLRLSGASDDHLASQSGLGMLSFDSTPACKLAYVLKASALFFFCEYLYKSRV